MEAIHGTHCNVRYSRPKRCRYCGKTVIWYSCDHLSVTGIPLKSKDPWVRYVCRQYDRHLWKTEVGPTPLGRFVIHETSPDQTESFETVMALIDKLLKRRHQKAIEGKRVLDTVVEYIRLSDVLLILPEELRGKDVRFPEALRERRNGLIRQRQELLNWRQELLTRNSVREM